MIIGLDESNRSPPISSMYFGAVAVDDLRKLNDPNIKDNKKLRPQKVRDLFKRYKGKVKWEVTEVTAKQISKWDNINEMERYYFKELIKKFNVDKGYIDRFSRKESHLDFDDKFVIEYKADENYNIVSLAGIFAKYHDLLQREELKEKYGIKNTEALNIGVHKFICENPNSNLIRKNFKTYKRAKECNFDFDKVMKKMNFKDYQ